MREPLAPPVQQRKAAKQPPPKENKITPPDPVLELVERFERNLDEYKRPDYKEARVRNVQWCAEHEDMPDNQARVAAGVGGMVGLRRTVAQWWLRGIIGVQGVVFELCPADKVSEVAI